MQFIELAAREILVLLDDLNLRQFFQRGDCHNQVNVLRIAAFDVLQQHDVADEQLFDLTFVQEGK